MRWGIRGQDTRLCRAGSEGEGAPLETYSLWWAALAGGRPQGPNYLGQVRESLSLRKEKSMVLSRNHSLHSAHLPREDEEGGERVWALEGPPRWAFHLPAQPKSSLGPLGESNLPRIWKL